MKRPFELPVWREDRVLVDQSLREIVVGDTAEDAEAIEPMVNHYDGLVAALKEIAESQRGYTGNPYTVERCSECEDMRDIARKALAGVTE